MVKMESDCVGCSPDLPCIGSGCQYYGQYPHFYCDDCGDPADYILDGEEHYCADCLADRLNEEFNDLGVNEKAEMLDHLVVSINGL